MVQHLPVRRVGPFFMEEGFLNSFCSKFYAAVTLINLTGLVLAATGIWQYPRRYTGAFVLGNLLTAILMRNELFGRLLYLFVNTCFAKASSLHDHFLAQFADTTHFMTVASALVQIGLHIGPAASRRHPLRLRHVGLRLAHLQSDPDLHRPQGKPRCGAHHGGDYKPRGSNQYRECLPLGPEYPSQVCSSVTIVAHSSHTRPSVFERHHRFIGW